MNSLAIKKIGDNCESKSMTKFFRTSLDDKMDQGIDKIIEQLQQAKNARTYLRKAAEVAKIAEQCQEYGDCWTDRIYDYMD